MAKRTPPSRVPKRAKTDDQVREEGFTPFLRAEHTKEGEAFALTGWNKEHADGQQIICEVENAEGTQYSLGVRKGSPDHRVLHKALGADWQNWRGGLTVTLRAGKQGDMVFVNVAAADKSDPFV